MAPDAAQDDTSDLSDMGDVMRQPGRAVAVAVVLLGVLAGLGAVPAAATHRPAAYCTPDLCTSTYRSDGVRKFRITSTSSLGSYRLCVTGPNGDRTCEFFETAWRGEDYRDVVRWRRHFPYEGKGAYTVAWFNNGRRVGTPLGFHVR